MTDPKVTPDTKASTEAVVALMIQECKRLGFVQRYEPATEVHRQQLPGGEARVRSGQVSQH